MKYLSEGTMGGYKIVDSKNKSTGVFLSDSEYESILNKITDAEYFLIQANQDYDRKLSEFRAEANKEYSSAQGIIAELKNEVDILQEKLKIAQDLNRNLIRISKERANSDRKLKPKKEHSGYVILSMQQKIKKERNGKVLTEEVIWEALIQTPYLTELTAEQVDVLVKSDCPFVQLFGVHQSNQLFYKANYKVGYWELIYSFTAGKEETENEKI